MLGERKWCATRPGKLEAHWRGHTSKDSRALLPPGGTAKVLWGVRLSQFCQTPDQEAPLRPSAVVKALRFPSGADKKIVLRDWLTCPSPFLLVAGLSSGPS